MRGGVEGGEGGELETCYMHLYMYMYIIQSLFLSSSDYVKLKYFTFSCRASLRRWCMESLAQLNGEQIIS